MNTKEGTVNPNLYLHLEQLGTFLKSIASLLKNNFGAL